MAGVDTRISVTPAPIPAGGGARSQRVDAAREAQRAFFNAALAGEGHVPTSVQPSGKAAIATTPALPTGGVPRPGSIVDIKV